MDAPRWTHFFRENSDRRRGDSDIEYENSFSWNASFSRTMTSKTSTMSSYENSEILTGPLHHTSHCHSREMQYLRPMVSPSKETRVQPVSTQYDSLCRSKEKISSPRIQVTKNGILNRELPPIPQQKSPTTDSRPQQKHRGRNRPPERGSNKKKTSQQNTETSVVLSVSLRSKKSHKNSKRDGKTLHEHSRHDSLNRKYVREDSTNSQKEFIGLPNRRARRRRQSSVCVIPLIVLTVVILGGLFGALGFILLNSKKEDGDKSRTEFDMVLAKTHMKVLNKEFTEELKNNASELYLTFTKTFTDQVNYLFLTSNYSNFYYGSEISDLRQGSINSISDVLFKDTSDLRNPKTVESLIKHSSPTHTYEGNKAINLGEYVVDYNSIYVDIRQFKLYELPERPQLKVKDFEVTKEIFVTSKSITESESTTTKDSTKFSYTTSTRTSQGSSIQAVSSTTSSTTQGMVSPDERLSSTTADTSTIITRSERKEVTKEASTESVILSTQQTITEIPLPIVSVSNLTINTTTQNASVVCSLSNLEFWEYLTVEHVSTDKINSVIINVTSEGSLDFPSMQYSNRLFLDLRIGFSSATITLNFTVDCSDDGSYICQAYADNQLYTGKGELRIRDPPTTPIVTVPIEVVENRPIEYPIICRGNAGFPAGRLQWLIKPPNQQRFFPVPGTSSSSDGKCGNIVTNEFVLAPSMAGNGTTLKCQVINDHYLIGNTSGDQLSDTTILRVVPASVCRDIAKGTTIRHPYRCDKYINCTSENDFKVYQCPEELCFDIKTGQCGQTGLSLTNTTAFLNEGVTSLTCRLQHVGRWSGLQIYRETATGRNVLLVVKYSPNGPPIKLMSDTIKHRYFSVVNTKRYEVEVILWIYKLNCNDNGHYKCRADIPFQLPDADGYVNMIVKPESPILSAPTEIVDGRGLRENFTCKANVGYPGGNLFWEIRLPGRNNFTRNLPFNIGERIEEKNCSRQISKEFSLIPSPKFDGLELRCVVENENALARERFLMTSYVIHVIPVDTCSSNSTGPLPHPSDCRQYIQCTNDYLNVQRCSQSLCFNPDTLECDLPEPVDQTPVDPNSPCKPNKNGVYFPHPFICNIYFWCVGGQEVIQRCPLGTLYKDEGQCTFDTNSNSHCFKTV